MKKLTAKQIDVQHRVFSALGNLKRITILNYLRMAKGPVTAGEVEKATGVPASIVYDHVRVLRTAGIIKAPKKTRLGPVAQTIELVERNDNELTEFFTWFEEAATFKKIFKSAPQERMRAPDLRMVAGLDS